MLLKQNSLSENVHCFLIKQFIRDCPLFFNKTGYWRLSSAFETKQFIGDCPLFLNKTVYRRLSTVFY